MALPTKGKGKGTGLPARGSSGKGGLPTLSGGGWSVPVTPKSKRKDDGGFFEALGRAVAHTARGAEEIVTGIPTGAVAIGQGLGQDTAKALSKTPVLPKGRYAKKVSKSPWQSPLLATAVGKGLYGDIRHPLRNPAATALTLSAFLNLGAGAAARGAAAAKAAKSTSKANKARRTKASTDINRAKKQPYTPAAAKLAETLDAMEEFASVSPLQAALAAAKRKPVYLRTFKTTNKTKEQLQREVAAQRFAASGTPAVRASKPRKVSEKKAPPLKKAPEAKPEAPEPEITSPILARARKEWEAKQGITPDARTAAAQKAFRENKRPKVYANPRAEKKAEKAAKKAAEKRSAREAQLAFPLTNPEVTVSASRSALGRGIRNALIEPAYRQSLKRMEAGKPGGGMASRRIRTEIAQRSRIEKQRAGVHAEAKELPFVSRALRGPANLMRLGMFLRPRYLTQNVLGTGILLGLQQGTGVGRSVSDFKRLSPEAQVFAKNTMGGTGAASIAAEAGGKGHLARATHYLADRLGRPEAAMRPAALMKAARDEGLSVQQLDRLLRNPKLNPDQFHRIARKANDAVVDYSRLGNTERAFMATQLPIFYPMTKGFTRYTAQFPGEHPMQAALLAQLGKEGSKKQKKILGDRPFWGEYQVPVNKKGLTIDPTLIYPFQPGADVARETAQSVNKAFTGEEQIPGLNLLRHAGPLPNMAFEAITGRQLSTSYPSREDPTLDFARSLGPIELLLSLAGKNRNLKSFEKSSVENQILNWFLGRSFAARQVKKPALKKQAKREHERRNLHPSINDLLP